MTPAALQVMTVLLSVGAMGATREHVVHKADIATTTFYRVVQPLLSQGLVLERDGRYSLPLDNPYNYRFKLWHDMERLYALDEPVRNAVLELTQSVRADLGDTLRCLFLVGSAAHGTVGPQSDLDFLAVLTEDSLYHPTADRPVNFVTMSEAVFRSQYEAADDFVVGALRYGILLVGEDFAQAWYRRVLPVAEGKQQNDTQAIAMQERRFLSFVKMEAFEDSRHTMSSLAVAQTRALLRSFGLLPAGKPDLVHSSSSLLGRSYTNHLETALSQRAEMPELMTLLRFFSDVRRQYAHHRLHLERFATMGTCSESQFAHFVGDILGELVPDFNVEYADAHKDYGVDIVLTKGGYIMCAVECKVSRRDIQANSIDTLVKAVTMMPGTVHGILIASAWRDIPLTERPVPPPGFLQRAKAGHVAVVTALDLLRAHNELHLLERPPMELAQELGLVAHRKKRQTTVVA